MPDILPIEFNGPGDPTSLSPEERAQWKLRYARHVSTAASRTADTDPSKVIDPDSAEGKAVYAARERAIKERVQKFERTGSDPNSPFRFIPGVGYIVDREDPNMLGMRFEDAEEALKAIEDFRKVGEVRHVSKGELYRRELESMDPIERDVELRFGRI